MAKANQEGKAAPPSSEAQGAGSEQAQAIQVEVICEGRLGRLLLTKGQITTDREYIALLDTERGRRLVKEVK